MDSSMLRDTDLHDDDNRHNNPDHAPRGSHNKRGTIECDTTETTAFTLRIVHTNVPPDYKGAHASENIRYILAAIIDSVFNVAILVLQSEFPLISSGRWPVEERGIIMRKTKRVHRCICREFAVCAPSGAYS
jgi:hypothetical protein